MDHHTFKLSSPHQDDRYRNSPLTFIPLTPTVEDSSCITTTSELLLMTPQESLSLPQEFHTASPPLQNNRLLLAQCQQDIKAQNETPMLSQRSPSLEHLTFSLEDDEKFFLMAPKEQINNLEIDSCDINLNKKFKLKKRPCRTEGTYINRESRLLPRPIPQQSYGNSISTYSTRHSKKKNSMNDNILYYSSYDDATSIHQYVVENDSNFKSFTLAKSSCSFRPIQNDED